MGQIYVAKHSVLTRLEEEDKQTTMLHGSFWNSLESTLRERQTPNYCCSYTANGNMQGTVLLGAANAHRCTSCLTAVTCI